MSTLQDEIEKELREFDDQFNFLDREVNWDTKAIRQEIRVFLSAALSRIAHLAYEDGWKHKDDIPMGVSQWKNHGKKFHYWEFFEKEAKQKGREDVDIDTAITKAKQEFGKLTDREVGLLVFGLYLIPKNPKVAQIKKQRNEIRRASM